MFSISEIKARLIRPKTVLNIIIAEIIVFTISIPFWDIYMTLRGQSSQIETYICMFYVLIGVIIFLLMLSIAEVFGIEVPEINEQEEIVLITRRGKFVRYASSYEWKWPFEAARKYYRRFKVTCNITIRSEDFKSARTIIYGQLDIEDTDFLLQFDQCQLILFIKKEVNDLLNGYSIAEEGVFQKDLRDEKDGARRLLVQMFEEKEIPVFGVRVEMEDINLNN